MLKHLSQDTKPVNCILTNPTVLQAVRLDIKTFKSALWERVREFFRLA